MALDKATLEQALVTIFTQPTTQNNAEQRAKQLADAFEAYVKSGQAVGTCPPNGGLLVDGKLV
ncbi:hypothetical protein [Flavobacterium cerinum]|uniref:Uncharacterized protein n=1 Tax=Flavobacterium cerinum TaxID=2502784 RepID=A0A444GLH3_9FLAO|nr:hypothetical protein [Flavobacterium cerinum]RWW91866.1 hypothetical protein EPI11_17645 [Flavobacterium cerinum]